MLTEGKHPGRSYWELFHHMILRQLCEMFRFTHTVPVSFREHDDSNLLLLQQEFYNYSMPNRSFYVYIMTNKSRTLYTGMTNDLFRRVTEHKEKTITGFTSRYNINKLVYFEEFPGVYSAIEREKQIKGWLRSKKIALIEGINPNWHDLSIDWLTETQFYSNTGTPLAKRHLSEKNQSGKIASQVVYFLIRYKSHLRNQNEDQRISTATCSRVRHRFQGSRGSQHLAGVE